jgi:hypothetical protein
LTFDTLNRRTAFFQWRKTRTDIFSTFIGITFERNEIMEFNVASPFKTITGSDVFLDGSFPYPTATVSSVVLHNTTSQSTDVLTSVTSSTGQQTQHVGSVGYNGGISTIATVTHTVSRPVDTRQSKTTVRSWRPRTR